MKMDIYNQVKEVPANAKKTIGAGRLKGFTDINPMWRIKKLTELFGPAGIGWYYETAEKWSEKVENGEILCFVTVRLYIKQDEWSKPIEGTGGSKIASKEKAGLYFDDEGYKKATTDALGNACKSLGIGADVWWESDRTKYTAPKEETQGQKKAPDQVDKETAEKVSGQKIDGNMWNALQSTYKKKGVSQKTVLERCGVERPGQITVEAFKKVMGMLETMKDMEVKA